MFFFSFLIWLKVSGRYFYFQNAQDTVHFYSKRLGGIEQLHESNFTQFYPHPLEWTEMDVVIECPLTLMVPMEEFCVHTFSLIRYWKGLDFQVRHSVELLAKFWPNEPPDHPKSCGFMFTNNEKYFDSINTFTNYKSF